MIMPGGEAYLFGGQTTAGVTNSAERIEEDGSSHHLAPMPLPIAGHSCTALRDGRILVSGGAVAVIYDPAADQWSNQPTLEESRYGHRGDPVRNKGGQPLTATAPARWIQFSGYDWWVKTSSGSRVGPGPNLFSDSTNNVWVDSAGRLHLRITGNGNTWQCAELVSNASFGHGTYRFYLDTPVDNFDPNVVVGLFTWKTGDPAYYYREIDIEFSKWGNARSGYNADYAVQPYTTPGQSIDFYIPAGLTKTTHSFLWAPGFVTARSVIGDSATPSNPSQVIREHTFRNGIPPAGGENVRMNLWLFQGRAPKTKRTIEVIVNRFEFVPLAP